MRVNKTETLVVFINSTDTRPNSFKKLSWVSLFIYSNICQLIRNIFKKKRTKHKINDYHYNSKQFSTEKENNPPVVPNPEFTSRNGCLQWKAIATAPNFYCPLADWVRWVSILTNNGEYGINEQISSLTLLFCSAWARCCAPSSPILFPLRPSVMSVYIEEKYWRWNWLADNLYYCVIFQCSSEMLCTIITDIVPIKVECSQCLYSRTKLKIECIRKEVVLLCYFAVLQRDIVHLHHRYCSDQGSV
jgi:hypothetical protein